MQYFPNFSMYETLPESWFWAHTRDSDTAELTGGLRIYMSNELPGDVNDIGSKNTFWEVLVFTLLPLASLKTNFRP